MKKTSIHLQGFLFIFVLSFFPLLAFGQFINVIKIAGNTAVISEGTGGGIRKGDTVKISRLISNNSIEIAIAPVIQAEYNQSTVQLPAGIQPVKIGDNVEKIIIPPVPKSTSPTQTAVKETKTTPRPSSKTPKAVSRQPSRTNARRNAISPTYQTEKKVYLGPQIGVLIPMGDMADVFESRFGYGGIVGAQFRKNLDICLQFFFTAKKNEWSFWNLQMLGRRYLNRNVLFDFGYGIAYPEYFHYGFRGGGNIQLGLCGGLTYSAPLSNTLWFEMGALFQYYPNFGETAGQFLTIQGRLLM